MSHHCNTVIRRTSVRLFQSCNSNSQPAGKRQPYPTNRKSNSTLLQSISSNVSETTSSNGSNRLSSSNPVYSASLHQQQMKQSSNEPDNTYHEEDSTSTPTYQTQRESLMESGKRTLSVTEPPSRYSNQMETMDTPTLSPGRNSYFSNIRQSMNSSFNANMSTSTAALLNYEPNAANSSDSEDNFSSSDDSESHGSSDPGDKSSPQSSRKSNLWTSSLSKSINWFYNQTAIDTAAAKVSTSVFYPVLNKPVYQI